MSARGIPTVHQGYQMRSRLEAKWASLFDQLGWTWEYEPFDLAGYVPDFVIPAYKDRPLVPGFGFPGSKTAPRPVLVEVKGPLEELASAQAKINASGWVGPAIVVFDSTLWKPSSCDGVVVGSVRCNHDDSVWDECTLGRCDSWAGHWGVCETYMSYGCKLCGHYDGNPVGLAEDEADLRAMWAHAQNATQWRAPR